MKILITENQLDYIKKFEPYKRSFFKFWDKIGPKIDNDFLNFFGFKNGILRVDDMTISTSNLYVLLREWHGEKNAINKALEFLNQDKFTIDNCGGYNFDFYVETVEVETLHNNIQANGTIVVRTIPDLENGTMDFDGETKKLIDAIEDVHYGLDIEIEISECIDDFLKDNITNTFGVIVLKR